MSTQRILKVANGKLCAVIDKTYGRQGEHKVITLAQPIKTYHDDECKLVVGYIASKLKDAVDIIQQPFRVGASEWTNSYLMNQNVEECINHIIRISDNVNSTEKAAVSIGYHGSLIYFNCFDLKDMTRTSDTTFNPSVSAWVPKPPSETETKVGLEVIGGQLCSVTDRDLGDGKIEHLETVLAQPVITYDGDECKLVFDYILSKLKGRVNIIPDSDPVYHAVGWAYNYVMNDDIEECINFIAQNAGNSKFAFKYHGGVIYFNRF